MCPELDDYLAHCRVERRLAPLTCRAYERDVRTFLAYLAREDLALDQARTPQLRAFLAEEATTARRRPAKRVPSRR